MPDFGPFQFRIATTAREDNSYQECSIVKLHILVYMTVKSNGTPSGLDGITTP